MSWAKRRQPAASVLGMQLSMLDRVAGEVAAGGWRELDQLVAVLLDLDRSSDADLAGEVLARLQAMPAVVARLDEQARRVLWWSAYFSPAMDEAASRIRDGTAGPIAVALGSTHGDGHVREEAVVRMLAAPAAGLMPFLVLRSGDWVKPVRDRARAGLALLLDDDPQRYLPAALGMILLVRTRLRGGYAPAQALSALVNGPQSLRDKLLAEGDARQRRWVFDLGLALGWWAPKVMLAAAVNEPNPSIRAQAAEAVCRQAVWSRQTDTLRRLAGHRTPQVRAVAVTGLVRLGHDAEVAGYLDDAAALVRAIARDAARRTGVHAPDHYRAAVVASDPPLGAIAGLAETGNAGDAPLLHNLLTHPTGRVRAHALRALRLLQAVPIEPVIALLRDPSPAVVREATTALRPFTRAVPDHVAWGLLADTERVELRRAGYYLLRVRTPTHQLRAALLLANDPAPRLARRAVADVTRLARDAAQPDWRRRTLPALNTAPDQVAELVQLTHQAAQILGDDTTRMIHTWLDNPGQPRTRQVRGARRSREGRP